MKELMKKIKNNKGITMITLVVSIIMIMLITGTLIYKSKDAVEIRNLTMMYNDIELLDSKVEEYYMETGALPNGNVYGNTDFLDVTYARNSDDRNDAGELTDYYVINLNYLDGITTLNYGRGFDSGNANETDVYIINENSHQIYYVRGIKSGDKTYYTNEFKQDITKKIYYKITYNANGGDGYIDDDILIKDKSVTLNDGTNIIRNGYILMGWNTESDKTGTTYELGAKLSQRTRKYK